MALVDRRYHLTEGPAGLGLSCTAEGLSLAGAPLLRKAEAGIEARPAEEIEVLVKAAYGGAIEPGRLSAGLNGIAEALNCGELGRAMMTALHLRLPDLDEEAAARVAGVNDDLAKYSPDQPRDWHGRWTLVGDDSGRGGGGTPASGQRLKPAPADPVEQSERVFPHVTKFRNEHLSDATKLAAIIGHGATADEVLAVSGVESTYGTDWKATDGGNFFGLHVPEKSSPFAGQIGRIKTAKDGYVAVFRRSDGFWYSGLVFAHRMASGAAGLDLSDPHVFFALAHSRGWGTTEPRYYHFVLSAHRLLQNSARATGGR